MTEDKVCKHCGTSDNLIIDSNGVIWRICKECRSKQSKSNNIGKILTKQHRENISKSIKGINHPNFGKKLSEQTKLNIGKGNKGKIQTIEHRQKNSNANKGKKLTIEHRDKIRISQIGDKNHNFGKEADLSTRIKMSKTRKYSVKDYQEKYPLFCLMEEIREAPFEIGKASIQVHCKKCNDWYTPFGNKVSDRIRVLENNIDGCYFYCSDECKNSCPLFGSHGTINNDQNIDRSEYQTFRQEVLNRQLQSEDLCFNHCEICNSESNLHVHHEHPQKTYPHLSLDPDNGIILCSTCHYKFGHTDKCSTASLANKICI